MVEAEILDGNANLNGGEDQVEEGTTEAEAEAKKATKEWLTHVSVFSCDLGITKK